MRLYQKCLKYASYVSILVLFIFLMKFGVEYKARNKLFISLKDKGINSKVQEVNAGLYGLQFKNVNLQFLNSNVKINTLYSNYTKSNIIIDGLKIFSSIEDINAMRAKHSIRSKGSASRTITITNTYANLNWKPVGKILITGIEYKDSVLSIRDINTENARIRDSKFNTRTKLGTIKSIIRIAPDTGVRRTSINIPKFDIEIPNVEANFNIEYIQLNSIQAKNVNLTSKDGTVKLEANSISQHRQNGFVLVYGAQVIANKSEAELHIDNIEIQKDFISKDKFNLNNISVLYDLQTTAGIGQIGNTQFSAGLLPNKHIHINAKCSDVMRSFPNSWNPTFNNAEALGVIDASLSISDDNYVDLSLEQNCIFISTSNQISSSALAKPMLLTFERSKPQLVGPGTKNWIPIDMISEYMTKSLLITEDAAFFQHTGVDPNAIEFAINEYIKNGPQRGGSTITMQLAKNLWLGPERTIQRKVEEVFLAFHLETTLHKHRILEWYMNCIEFGPNVFGIHDAALHYFGSHPIELTLKQSLFLSSILPRPKDEYFINGILRDSTEYKLNSLLDMMYATNKISEQELITAKNEKLIKYE